MVCLLVCSTAHFAIGVACWNAPAPRAVDFQGLEGARAARVGGKGRGDNVTRRAWFGDFLVSLMVHWRLALAFDSLCFAR
eukprot:7245615-Pyramimonas_sp.AAC.1